MLCKALCALQIDNIYLYGLTVNKRDRCKRKEVKGLQCIRIHLAIAQLSLSILII